ncbi:NAD(P)H-dependent oxidoreductase [Kaistia geumhonensis]|uniref:NAD(P)H-dependent FMN reductase n=1 Tax=Kaistia geumhonensis TaxID=410839 RepID=A0ABU0M7S0_9HYPH|nr:NAD(P)H-dependent oxidoreductase [Kaistia geumhonensis]MCX5477811.1 NAD(P)H-dependent oxidoreductase [Kaistia geumhonensis]MDQ0516977.1 NAD(P)H-dependent FMN reductase [Kaistia geumhonensis]
MAPPRILLLAGSTAPASPASRLAAAFAREIVFLDAEATLLSLADYSMPLRDADGTASVPDAAAKLGGMLRAHSAVFIATPSLFGGMPALLCNALEWLAAVHGRPKNGAPLFALAAASDDETGALSALGDLERFVARGFSATLVGGGLAIGRAGLAFDAKGRLDDPQLSARLQALARETVFAARRLVPDS